MYCGRQIGRIQSKIDLINVFHDCTKIKIRLSYQNKLHVLKVLSVLCHHIVNIVWSYNCHEQLLGPQEYFVLAVHIWNLHNRLYYVDPILLIELMFYVVVKNK